MRTSSAAGLILGATLLVAGIGILSDGSPTRGVLAQSVAGWFDMKERQCRAASVAVGAACPVGCASKPIGSPSNRSAPPECHSALWVETCGKACSPSKGFARLRDGRLIDGGQLTVVLRAEPDKALLRELFALGITLTPRFDGLDRYDADTGGTDIMKIKKRLSALPQVASAEFVPR